MAREVVWAEPARQDLERAAEYIARDSEAYAASIVQDARAAAASLEELAERGQLVPELGDPSVRELLLQPYRLVQEIMADKVVLLGLVRGARTFRRTGSVSRHRRTSMSVSSRTPEGSPNHCPICGNDVVLEPSQAGDGTCPYCGHLLWWFSARFADRLGVDAAQITASTSFASDLGADSLDVVELVMELEDAFDINIPDVALRQIQKVGDAIRYIQGIQSGDTPT